MGLVRSKEEIKKRYKLTYDRIIMKMSKDKLIQIHNEILNL